MAEEKQGKQIFIKPVIEGGLGLGIMCGIEKAV
jgi:hypothetical protein